MLYDLLSLYWIFKCVTKASLSWAEWFLVIERSEIQCGSSVFVLRGPDLACVWGGHDFRSSHFSLLEILSQDCDNSLGQFWEPRTHPKR